MSVVTEPESPPVPSTTSPTRWHQLLGVAIPAAAGALMALLMPRGPVTPVDVIVSMVIGAGVGVAVGWLNGRWAILIAPVLFAVSLELARLGVAAPSLDGIHLDSGFGLILFVTTRGLHFAVALVPMICGSLIGSSIRRRAEAGRPDVIPKVASTVLAVVILLVSVVVARPAHTDPILGGDGLLLAESVAELVTVELGDSSQEIMVRGHDIASPVLLYLTGGPGNSDLGYTRTFLEELEEDFVLVSWDQRGVGKSYPAIDPVSTLTLDSAVTDVIELTSYLTERFEKEEIYLFGNSWGSIIGSLAAERRPDLYSAYIGTGQMVSPLETDLRLYQQLLDYARRNGDHELLDKMIGFGKPPYEDLHGYMTVIENYGNLEPYRKTSDFASGPPGIQGTGVTEYGFMDKLNVFRGLADMGGVVYAQVQGLDLRTDVPSLEIPVYLIQGGHELTARADLVEDYVSLLQAPSLTVEVFENSGHVPHFEEAGRFHDYLVDVVLAETQS